VASEVVMWPPLDALSSREATLTGLPIAVN